MTSGVLAPRYSVKFYRKGVYELIRFKRAMFPHLPPKRGEGESIPRGEAVPGNLSGEISDLSGGVLQ